MCTLARLSFWVSPDRRDEFEAIYKKKVVPILKKHGLAHSSERGRPTVEGVFSRLFEVETPAELVARKSTLQKDAVWQEVLRDLGATFGTPEPSGPIPHRFGIYAAPAGPGKAVEAGPGYRQGLWQSFGPQDGFPASLVSDILEDREGNLWFATEARGGIRYDGAQFLAFGAEDGLAENAVLSLLEDQAGNLWFGMYGRGICRYDGREFVTFTVEDGLGSNTVWCLLEDENGHLWIRTWQGGMSRYDLSAGSGGTGERFELYYDRKPSGGQKKGKWVVWRSLDR